MKNKIIILLMFILVIVLVIVAWQSWSEDSDVHSIHVTTEKVGQDSDFIREINKQASEIQTNIPTVNNREDDGLSDTVSDTLSQDKELADETLCELVENYDDWQKTSSGYNSQKLINEIRGWGDTRGYFEMEYNGSQMEIKKKSDYDYYETEDLQQMADAGDSIANVKLAYRLFLSGDETSLEEAQPYCERAIVDGYTAMHGCIIAYLNNLLSHYENQEEPEIERIKELQIESQAWKAMYGLRGDPLGEIMFESSLTEIEGVEISDEEIEQRAQALYQDVVRERTNLGLGPFEDTQAPDIVVYAVSNDIDEDEIANCFE